MMSFIDVRGKFPNFYADNFAYQESCNMSYSVITSCSFFEMSKCARIVQSMKSKFEII